ncbi:MAG: lipid-A-disaccharide synthase [Verrucomicrobiales bacterium]|jgi:lipid-A-disaccharide synthase
MKTLFLVSGEVSGDTHGAELIESLQQLLGVDTRVTGLGGPRMKEVAHEIEDWLEDAAVLGLTEVLKKYGYFKKKLKDTIAAVHALDPDVLILIDYPGFNLRLAKALRVRGWKGKIAYYISPQVWAWKRGRIKSMAKILDLMICIFPFEKVLYEKSGLRTEFAGHPLVDELHAKRIEAKREPNLIGLFPGSRRREIEALFPTMAEAAKQLRETQPDLRFVAVAANAELAERLREIATEQEAEIDISSGDIHEWMQRVSCATIASGTATLEAAFFRLPYVIVYKVAKLTAFIARRVMKVDYLGIVNVLADREVVKELLQENFTAERLAEELKRLIDNDEGRQQLLDEMKTVVNQLGEGGAHENAAKFIGQLVETPLPSS